MVVPPLKFKMENPNNKCMILEVPLFEETPIWGKKRIKRIDLSIAYYCGYAVSLIDSYVCHV